MMYAVPVWGKALQVLGNTHKLSTVYRRTSLRVCSAFRTISDDATFVISGMMPLDILATKMMNIYNTRSIFPLSQVKKVERERSISRWQQRWDQPEKGGWTYRLILSIGEWLKRKDRESKITPPRDVIPKGGSTG